MASGWAMDWSREQGMGQGCQWDGGLARVFVHGGGGSGWILNSFLEVEQKGFTHHLTVN